jgi:predicted DNA-binding mobile mystery protein A
MTTAQFAKRLKITQSRVTELEQAEVHGSITLRSLERSAAALGCRVVYAFVPDEPLQETLQRRADALAQERLASVEQTMRLEDQAARGSRGDALKHITADLLRRPARLWDAQ